MKNKLNKTANDNSIIQEDNTNIIKTEGNIKAKSNIKKPITPKSIKPTTVDSSKFIWIINRKSNKK